MIKIGETLPSALLTRLVGSKIEEVILKDYIKGKRIVFFAVPGAFTPTCSSIHLPSFVKQADAIKKKGIDEIICVSMNDPYVLDVWGKVAHTDGKITLLSDGNGDFTRAMGLVLDASAKGLGIRSQRYVALVENGILKSLQVEPQPSECTVTCADEVVKHL